MKDVSIFSWALAFVIIIYFIVKKTLEKNED